MMQFVCWLTIIKTVTSCKEIEKDCDKKDCDNWKDYADWKGFVIIEKDLW